MSLDHSILEGSHFQRRAMIYLLKVVLLTLYDFICLECLRLRSYQPGGPSPDPLSGIISSDLRWAAFLSQLSQMLIGELSVLAVICRPSVRRHQCFQTSPQKPLSVEPGQILFGAPMCRGTESHSQMTKMAFMPLII